MIIVSGASTSKSLAVDNRKVFEPDKMSESYHEIFDSQMPPESAAQLCENSEAEDALEMGKINFSTQISLTFLTKHSTLPNQTRQI